MLFKGIGITSLLRYTVLFFIATTSAVSVSYAETNSCSGYYQDLKIKAVKSTRRWHNLERAIGDGEEPKYKPKGFVRELKEAEMTNQCQTSECYLFSLINFINTYNRNQLGDSAPMISEPYLVAQKFLEHIKEGLRLDSDDPQFVHDLEGGFSYEAVFLTRQVGLVPKGVWKPKVPLDEWDTAKIYKFLGRKVPEWHRRVAVMAKQNGWKSIEVKLLQEHAYNELKHIILDNTGPLPESFKYKNRSYTPHTFEHKYGIPRIALFQIHNQDGYVLPENYSRVLRQSFTNEGGHYRVRDGNFNSLVYSAKRYIDQGLPIILDLNWKNDGHSMLIVGYELDRDTQQLVRLKVMNSWGNAYANKGYAWFTVDDVMKNVTGTYRIAIKND